MTTSNVTIDLLADSPEAHQIQALRELAAAAHSHDGSPPFGDQTWVELGRESADASRVAVCYAWELTPDQGRGRLAGAGVVVLGDSDQTHDDAAPHTLELVVHPDSRGLGVARQLAQTLNTSDLAAAPIAAQRAWAHGGHPGGPQLAAHFGWSAVRELWQMRLENTVQLQRPDVPRGVTLRAFRPGEDEDAWLRVNAAAFADHPEQGRLTLDDLKARMAEEWFSADGFLMAWEPTDGAEEALLGFHWTKIHHHPDGQQVGEVYAVGVAPAAQGRSLGAALTAAGIDHLRAQGVEAVILYVDADNTAAAGLYKKLGFEVTVVDTQYAPAGAADSASS